MTKKYIDPAKFYSLSELLELSKKSYFPIKTKVTLLNLINKGRLAAVNVGSTDKVIYTIKGEVLLAFLSQYVNGEIPNTKPRKKMHLVRKKR